jgi:hypothetical protein
MIHFSIKQQIQRTTRSRVMFMQLSLHVVVFYAKSLMSLLYIYACAYIYVVAFRMHAYMSTLTL